MSNSSYNVEAGETAMPGSQQAEKDTQAAIFSSYDWWNHHCLLFRINEQRCDYIEACVDRVFGRGAIKQQEGLDIGCGGGLICENLVRRGATVVGIDPSDQALRAAREHIIKSGLGHNAWFVQGYAEALPFASGSFSVITCLDALEHVRDLQATIGEIARVLAPAASLSSTPSIAHSSPASRSSGSASVSCAVAACCQGCTTIRVSSSPENCERPLLRAAFAYAS